MTGFNMKVTPEIEQLTEMCKDHSSIDLSLYGKYDVKKEDCVILTERVSLQGLPRFPMFRQ